MSLAGDDQPLVGIGCGHHDTSIAASIATAAAACHKEPPILQPDKAQGGIKRLAFINADSL